MFGSSKSRKNARSGTPLDRKQEALQEMEFKLRKQKAELERLIHEAPRLREETAKRRRDAFAHDPRLSHSPMMDRHAYHVSTLANPAFGRRRLRSEKQDGLYLFLFLIAVLSAIVFWICKLVL